MKQILLRSFLLGFSALFISACADKALSTLTTSVEGNYWQTEVVKGERHASASELIIIKRAYEQTIDGFGAVFNELGWDALNMLAAEEKAGIMEEFYSEDGFNFTICRMPIGANDYARDWYSLNDEAGDFKMEHFNIDRDLGTLIPYISEALLIRPDLKVWGSPWCPPVWMKVNNHYACAPHKVNDLPAEGAGKENHTQFIMQEDYLDAYALYFAKYVEKYREYGINIYAVHVQNEPNSCQNFPSCIWTAKDLSIFIGQHLGPTFEEMGLDTDIWLGTIERPYIEKVDTVLQDPDSKRYISGVGFQWAGKACIPEVHKKYPEMRLMQTESECGDGSNDWPAAEYTWSLIKHYIENGANVYTYWNTILDETGKSMWGWKQNSLISVDSNSGQAIRNPEFYLMKHLSHFVKPGSKKLQTPQGLDCGLLFESPDNQIVGLLVNSEDEDKHLAFKLDGSFYSLILKAHSINSIEF